MNILYAIVNSCQEILPIPLIFGQLISKIYLVIKILIPIILIISSLIDFFKTLKANDEKTIKKRQSLIIKKIFFALMIYFLFDVISIIINLFSHDQMWQCIKGILNGK